jgi:hypothetical protein
LAARPAEEAPPSYGAWLEMRPPVEANEDEEVELEPPSAPAPSSVRFPQNLMTQSL